MSGSVRDAEPRTRTDPARPGRASRHGRRRSRWPFVLMAVGLLAALGILAALPALSARSRLEDGRDALQQARDLVLEGDVARARIAFEHAADAFDHAGDSARSPVLRATGFVPMLGRSSDALAVIADAGGASASAGIEITTAIQDLPEGIDALGPNDGGLPVAGIAALEPAVRAARADLEEARDELLALPTSFLIGPVARARDEALDELEPAVDTARAAQALTTALPAFVGSDGDKRYFVGAQATAELRGTGGLIGAYTILDASNGRLDMRPMRSITTLKDLPADRAPQAPAGYGQPFDRLAGTGFWRNLNMEPDAPTAASMIESLYAEVAGEHVDGTILVDAQALAALLEATGPVRPPGLDRTLDASNVVDYLTNEAYLEFGSAAERKEVLGAAVLAIWGRFLNGTDPIAALRALSKAASGGHLVLHSADPKVQAALEEAGVAGSWELPESGTLYGVATSNADGTKVDYYQHRDVRFQIALTEGGAGSIRSTTSFRNDAPMGADPSYVLGPFPGTGLDVGESRAFVATYCAPRCALEAARLDGRPVGVESHVDRGLPMFATFVRTEAGSSSALELDASQPHAWVGDDLGGTYALTVRGQPTIKPTTATVVVEVPEGMRVVDTNVPMDVDGRRATWHGTLGREQRIEIRFERPFPGRLWTELRNVLSTPVIEV